MRGKDKVFGRIWSRLSGRSSAANQGIRKFPEKQIREEMNLPLLQILTDLYLVSWKTIMPGPFPSL